MTYTVDTTDVRRLIAEAQSGDVRLADRAASCLISGNMGLVKSIARRFVGRGCEFDDLVQIGTIGMLKAIRSFDLDRGTAFSTYAVPLIIGEIRRHLRDSGLIKVGRATKKLGAELLGARSRIISEEGREPSVSELAAVAGVSPEEAAAAIGAMQAPASLSDTVGSDDSGLELEDRIPDGEGLAELEGVRDRIEKAKVQLMQLEAAAALEADSHTAVFPQHDAAAYRRGAGADTGQGVTGGKKDNGIPAARALRINYCLCWFLWRNLLTKVLSDVIIGCENTRCKERHKNEHYC